jgi:peptide deformylase
MPLTIVQSGEPVLRKPARPLRPNEIRSREIRELVQQMKETMYAAPGVGLARRRSDRGYNLPS